MWRVLPTLALLIAPALAKVTSPAGYGSSQADCATVAQKLNVPNATIYFSEFVTAGTNLSLPDNNVTCSQSSMVVQSDICRIALYVATSDRSGINMETWLPSNWTGRYLTTGNGGLNGCIKYEDLSYASGLGFAVAGANNGHNGSSGGAFYQNPEVVADFAWRSIHTSTVVGKEIAQTFYGSSYTKAYYLGCSTGGRQGWKSAQDFPDDFDGIVAGAPAFAFNNLTSWSGHFYLLTGPPTAATFVTQEQWLAVNQDILNQCDTLDSVEDGIIEDPDLCNYDPSSLACNSTNANTTICLTEAQVETVRGFFSPLIGNNNALVYPRLQPGYNPNYAVRLVNSGFPFPYATDWFRYAVYNDPTWDPTTLNPDDYDAAATVNPGNIQTFSGDLTAFRTSGGKILHWHGLSDGLISSDNSLRYYKHVLDTMATTPAALDEFYRYFRISGTEHCGGGSGAWMIGQGTDGAVSLDPNANVLTAIVRWVEEGVAPDTIQGTKYVNDNSASGVEIVRKHCRYPLRNTFVGVAGQEGNPDAWECVAIT